MKLLLSIFFLITSLLSQNLLKPYSTDGKILEIAIAKLEESNSHIESLLSKAKQIYYKTGELHLESINLKAEHIVVKKYYKSGQIHLMSNYVNGMKNGPSKVYYEDGTLAATVSYINNKMDYRYDEYYPNAKLHYQKYFTNGELDGPIIVYDLEGNKSFQLDYENSKEVCY